MTKKLLISLIFTLSISYAGYCVPDSVRIDTIENYNNWGWDVLVVQNNFINLAIVPSIGGRVLEYNLGVDTFMIVNDDLKGVTFDPATSTYGPYSNNWGYGGYKTWPAPQSNWNWPPPPIMAWGEYSFEVTHATADSVVIWLKGQTEEYLAPGLRFDRYMTIYKNSTRVKVKTVLFNDNDTEQSWSIWDVTQTIVEHENLDDFENFSAYIPIANSADVYDNDGGPSYEEVIPGVYQAKYTASEGKMFAAASEGWTCFVDERDAQTYAKLFEIVEGAEYPDDGTYVQYYTNGSNNYIEMEVLGPIEAISPNGGSISFTEDWYATSSAGAMHTANHAGIVKTPFSYSRVDDAVSGEFAVFNEGSLEVAYLNSNEELISTDSLTSVNPASSILLNQKVELPAGTEFVELQALDIDGNYIASFGRSSIITDDSFTAVKAGTDITIDGLANETFWDSATWYPLDYVWLPYGDDLAPEDFNGKFKISWNNYALLLFVEVIDDSLFDGHPQPLDNYWNDDCVEVFVDEDQSGGNHLNSYNAFAYHVSTTYDVVDNTNTPNQTALFNDHVDAKWVKVNDSTYTWELAISIYDDTYVSTSASEPVRLTHQKNMGFSLAYCDTDGSLQRENFIGSKYLPQSQSNDSYINASLFGKLELYDPKGGAGDPDPEPEPEPEAIANWSLSNVRLYPNPVHELLTIELNVPAGIHTTYSISSVTGQELLTGILESGLAKGTVDVSSLNAGIYFLNLQTKTQNYTTQIVIQ